MKLEFVITALVLTTVAFASESVLNGTLLPDETKRLEIPLAKGNNQVDISTDDYSPITCTFIDSASGMRIVEEKRMLCRGSANLNSPTKLVVDVYNTEAKAHIYRVRINNTK